MADLQLLKQGDNDEIRRTIKELELIPLAFTTVWRLIGAGYPGDARRLAFEAITKLFASDNPAREAAIQGCQSVAGIRPLVRTIAQRTAFDFLKDASRRKVVNFLEDSNQFAFEVQDADGILEGILAEGLGLETFELQEVLTALIEICQLDPDEEALLVEHILNDVIQQEFARQHRIPLGTVGGRKERLLRKIRSCLIVRSPWMDHFLPRRR